MATLKGKVIAITGAASGMGFEVAKITAERGAKLSLCDIQKEALEAAVAKLKADGADVIGTVVNVTMEEQVNSWIETTVERFGRLDGAANFAGVERKNPVFTPTADVTSSEWDFVLAVNTTGVFYCVRAQLIAMGPGASIVNAGSIAGLRGKAGLMPYVAAKFAVLGLTRTAAQEYGPKGIRVNAVAP